MARYVCKTELGVLLAEPCPRRRAEIPNTPEQDLV